jgi:DNA (cytosine-5)-methyltransferase 1
MKFIDFFSGIGGFRLGMEMAGHKCVGHCEIDKFADKSYRAMHDVKEGEWYAADIRAVESGDLPEADCWCGGFPCQAFSIAGKRAGFEDMRGTLIFEIFRLAAERKPKILFLENVAGLLNHDGGRTFATILTGLWELGYDVQWQVLNSKDFGVPQNRERVFIVGYFRGTSAREIFPIIGSNGETLKQLIGGSQGNRVYDTGGASVTLSSQGGGQGAKTGLYLIGKDGKEKKKEYASCLTGGGHSGGNHSDMDLLVEYEIRDTKNEWPGAKPKWNKDVCPTLLASHHKEPMVVRPVLTPDRLEKRQNGRRMKEPGEEMFTLTAQDRHGVMLTEPDMDEFAKFMTSEPNPSKQLIDYINKNNARIRRLIPIECFRLQGFPDEYFDRAAVVNSDSQLYKQAGNSVTVNVIYEVARRM